MLLFRAQQATQTQNFWVPQLSGNDSLRHKLGFCYWKPELSKTQKTRPKSLGKPERPGRPAVTPCRRK
jgi:hypothetical protein